MNSPVLNVVVQEFDILAAVRQDEIVRDAFIIVEKIAFDRFRLIAEAKDMNSTPLSRGFGSMRIQTSANCPAPPVCFLCRYFDSPRPLIVSRNGSAARRADVDVEPAAQTVREHFEMQLALRRKNLSGAAPESTRNTNAGSSSCNAARPAATLSSSPFAVTINAA